MDLNMIKFGVSGLSLKVFNVAKGVDGYFIPNDRFSTTLITCNFYIPLSADTMACDSLLPFLLSSCSEDYKDYIDLNIRLLELYGADLSCSATKCGDCFHIKLGINVINDSFSFDSCRPVIEAAELLCGLIFAPALENGRFTETDIDREKRKTIERIEGEINNKRSFARTRLFAEMFGSDPYGKFSYGSVEEVSAITSDILVKGWKKLLETAYVRICVVAGNYPEEAFDKFGEMFSGIDRHDITDTSVFRKLPENDCVNDLTERFDVTQGKLAMGYTSELHGSLKDAAALSLLSDIWGGGPYSKLFENVREKESLCYYCSASSRRSKGFLTVESGIEEKNAQKVVDAVEGELDDIRNGEFDDSVIEASKKSITDSLAAYYDNATALDAWYTRELGHILTPEQASEIISKVTREDIINAAKGVKLHTVYRLLPKERGEE